jgi:rhodanese-related sulfurtransferase
VARGALWSQARPCHSRASTDVAGPDRSTLVYSLLDTPKKAFGRTTRARRDRPANFEFDGRCGILWVDARSKAKFESRHIPGALLLNQAEWESLASDFYNQWQPGRQVVVYGEVDSDNGQEVASRLRDESAIENVWVLKGGYEAWRAR